MKPKRGKMRRESNRKKRVRRKEGWSQGRNSGAKKARMKEIEEVPRREGGREKRRGGGMGVLEKHRVQWRTESKTGVEIRASLFFPIVIL